MSHADFIDAIPQYSLIYDVKTEGLRDKTYIELKNEFSEKLIRIGLRKTARYNFICWRLGIGLTVFKNLRNVFNFNPEFIWVRDPMIAYLCLRRNSSVKIILYLQQ